MRNRLILVIISVLFAQVAHAVPPWTYTNTGMNHSIIIDTSVRPTVNGVPLNTGDFVGVFYDSNGTLACGGYEMWTGSGAIGVAAFGSDLVLPAKDGFAVGETFKWKIWRQSDSSIVSAQATYRPVGGIISDTSRYITNGLSSLRSLSGLSQYLINSSSGPNGSINPVGTDTVTFGMNQTFIINPNTGYHIDSVIVDGGKVDSTVGYTFTNVMANHSIRAVFKINQYPIIAIAGTHGTVSPSGTVQVNYGSSQLFTFYPDPGYTVDSLLVDSISVPAAPNYTFINVTRSHTLTVTFWNPQISVDVSLMSGWNMVSLPVQTLNDSVGILFSSAVSKAFSYNGSGYQITNELKAGTGYWLKFAEPENDTLRGTTLTNDTINLVSGWNMIGSISQPIAVSSVSSIPGAIVTSKFFTYKGGYAIDDSILPGKGYWVKVNQTGKLVLSSTAQALPSNSIRIIPTEELPPSPPGANEMERGSTPTSYALRQSYPNPFNPTSVISYSLPMQSFVRLSVYNVLGQEVATLVNGVQDAGIKSVEFDASKLPSGLYFYRITAGTFRDMKKMLLLK